MLIEKAVFALEDAPIDWPPTPRSVGGPLGGLLKDNGLGLANLTIGVVGLVAMQARMRTQPHWDLWPMPEPNVGRNGKPVVQHVDGRVIEGCVNGHYGNGARFPGAGHTSCTDDGTAVRSARSRRRHRRLCRKRLVAGPKPINAQSMNPGNRS